MTYVIKQWAYKLPFAHFVAVLPNDCWQWIGPIHKPSGTPIYKGRFPARTTSVAKYFPPSLLPPEYRVGPTLCKNKLCVNPWHQSICFKRIINLDKHAACREMALTWATHRDSCEVCKKHGEFCDTGTIIQGLLKEAMQKTAWVPPTTYPIGPAEAWWYNPECSHEMTCDDVWNCEKCVAFTKIKRAEQVK